MRQRRRSVTVSHNSLSFVKRVLSPTPQLLEQADHGDVITSHGEPPSETQQLWHIIKAGNSERFYLDEKRGLSHPKGADAPQRKVTQESC